MRKVEEGRQILGNWGQAPQICYGDVAAGLLQDSGAFLLPRSESDPANAARLAHLMLHRIDNLAVGNSALPKNALGCGDFVQRMMDGERRAYAVEIRIRRALGLEAIDDRFAELEFSYRRRCQRFGGNVGGSPAKPP
jgi:hypothetical protein